ncbi:hypothetical protein BC834DRAFT_850899 [Gloeopeniophorella convolvens]|nr:hypothetical protein BC834DRAFT_850899 [Gloeopeniophorella convolvens]
MTTPTPGITRWTSSIRSAMMNDPGRQFFEDQVQSQGFLFLEEYLDNIWAAAKQDSFVDLVKTPGRRRASPQKARPLPIHAPILDISDEKEDVFQSAPLNPETPSPTPASKLHARADDSPQQPRPRHPSLSQFPSLGAPSPLKKSTRQTRGSSIEPAPIATPGTGLTGNHTSWLAKVREAKAMEVNNKRASVTASGLAAPSGSLKRKSGELPDGMPLHGTDSEGRRAKLPKTSADITELFHLEPQPKASSALRVPEADVRATKSADDVHTMPEDRGVDMIDSLKKAVETLRARTGKSLAGNLAEVGTYDALPTIQEVSSTATDAFSKANSIRPSFSAPTLMREVGAPAPSNRALTPPTFDEPVTDSAPQTSRETDKRLSISDLVPKRDKNSVTSRESANDISISTTPPDSPPVAKKPTFFAPGGPVFNKPPPVFVPPPAANLKSSSTDSAALPKESAFKLPDYPLRAPFGLGLQSTKLSKSPPRVPLSQQSTQSSLFSDNIFDPQKNVPGWAPRSQDTQATSPGSQPVPEEKEPQDDLDDDDSWRMEDKFASTNQMWTPFAGITTVEDSMTWSTAPSQSQIGGKSPRQDPSEEELFTTGRSGQLQDVAEDSDQSMDIDDDMRKDVLEGGKPTVALVATHPNAMQSQMSLASSSGESSQAVGFFGHATKLVSTMLGVNKKNKTEPPKSLQLAAAVAKKQQEEQDRKATRLKEMEARRQAVLQKKVELDRVKAEEEEKKVKDDADRRKKEREETTGKRPLVKVDTKPVEDDSTKKRKVVNEIPKAKPPSKEKKDPAPTRLTKPSPNPSFKAGTLAKQSSTASLSQTSNVKAVPAEKPSTKAAAASAKGKGKAPAPVDYDDAPPKKVVQSQMAARAQAQLLEAEPPMASELIELPEPNSEYSDSEDEGRAKFAAPEWTQSPELRAALESQSTMNPDDIFGPVRPLRMEDIFRTRTSRFRARSSSANWSGPDGLKQEEEREYARRMGFR